MSPRTVGVGGAIGVLVGLGAGWGALAELGAAQSTPPSPPRIQIVESDYDQARIHLFEGLARFLAQVPSATFAAPRIPLGMAEAPSRPGVWAVAIDTGDVLLVDLYRSQELARSTGITRPGHVAFSEDGSRVFVLSNLYLGAARIVALRQCDLSEVGELWLTNANTTYEGRLRVLKGQLWVSTGDDASTWIYQIRLPGWPQNLPPPSSGTVKQVTVGRQPSGFEARPGTPELWVPCRLDHRLDLVDVRNGQLLRSIPLPEGETEPLEVAFTPCGRYACVGTRSALLVYDNSVDQFVESRSMGSAVYDLMVVPDDGMLSVVATMGGAVPPYVFTAPVTSLATGLFTLHARVETMTLESVSGS
jgi:hypothetical protein